MSDSVELNGLSIDLSLYQLVEREIAPGTGVEVAHFWQSLADIHAALGAENRDLLNKRNQMQRQIDDWHKTNPGKININKYKDFLKKIGYLVPEGESFQVSTDKVDDEVALIAGPQLVVPVDNSRYALNASKARWYSLTDARYVTALIPELGGFKKTSKYNPVHGQQVIRHVRDLHAQAAPPVLRKPLASASAATASETRPTPAALVTL